MPLSEEELRALEQMERALADEDPKFASTLRGTSLQRRVHRRAIWAGVVFVVGIVLLMAGAVMSIPAVGIAGFVIMLGSAMVALSARGAPRPEPRPSGIEGFGVVDGGRRGGRNRRGTGRDSSAGFMDRMEERWRRRREGGY